jgi:hypothetical protein
MVFSPPFFARSEAGDTSSPRGDPYLIKTDEMAKKIVRRGEIWKRCP